MDRATAKKGKSIPGQPDREELPSAGRSSQYMRPGGSAPWSFDLSRITKPFLLGSHATSVMGSSGVTCVPKQGGTAVIIVSVFDKRRFFTCSG